MKHDQRLAACGIDCTQCGSYKVTMYKDMEAAAQLVLWYRSQGWIGEDEGAEAVMRKNPLCKGCWDSTEDCFFNCGCGRVDFRLCCTQKEILHCGQCNEFPCEAYIEWVSMHDHHEKAMEYLQTIKKASWEN